MIRKVAVGVGLAILLSWAPVRSAAAACRPQSLVRNFTTIRPMPAGGVDMPGFAPGGFLRSVRASKGGVTVEWYGHSFFGLSSRSGTRIVTDPLAPGMYPTPSITAHAVTVGREHRNHNSVEIVRGNPVILRGLTDDSAEWRTVITMVREVEIRSIPVIQIGPTGEPMKGAAFTYDFGDICVAHMGDVGGKLSNEQLKALGLIDILLIPIGGRFTMGPEVARLVLGQIQPRVAIPMHYWSREDLLNEFVQGRRYRRIDGSVVHFTRESLPEKTIIFVLQPPGGGHRPVFPTLPFR